MIGSMAGGPAYYRDAAVRGNMFQRQYRCTTENGTAIDLTGYNVRWGAIYGDYAIGKSTEDGSLVMPTPSNGSVYLTLTPEETRRIPVNENMKYELEIYSGDAQYTVLWGDLVGKGGTSVD